MNLKVLKQSAVAAGLVSALWVEGASAETQQITASFRPDPTNVTANKFNNTTPQSSICLAHIPTQCKALGIFSLRFVSFLASSAA